MFNDVALGNDRVGFYVLDVTGESVPAALLATTLVITLPYDPTTAAPACAVNAKPGCCPGPW